MSLNGLALAWSQSQLLLLPQTPVPQTTCCSLLLHYAFIHAISYSGNAFSHSFPLSGSTADIKPLLDMSNSFLLIFFFSFSPCSNPHGERIIYYPHFTCKENLTKNSFKMYQLSIAASQITSKVSNLKQYLYLSQNLYIGNLGTSESLAHILSQGCNKCVLCSHSYISKLEWRRVHFQATQGYWQNQVPCRLLD